MGLGTSTRMAGVGRGMCWVGESLVEMMVTVMAEANCDVFCLHSLVAQLDRRWKTDIRKYGRGLMHIN